MSCDQQYGSPNRGCQKFQSFICSTFRGFIFGYSQNEPSRKNLTAIGNHFSELVLDSTLTLDLYHIACISSHFVLEIITFFWREIFFEAYRCQIMYAKQTVFSWIMYTQLAFSFMFSWFFFYIHPCLPNFLFGIVYRCYMYEIDHCSSFSPFYPTLTLGDTADLATPTVLC